MIMESLSSAKAHKCESAMQDESEDDIEFICEGPSRPVLDCIDLVSSDDEEPSSSSNVHRNVKRKDHIDYQKERVASTLDRLARHVEVEKQQKEEKNKAFKEKVDSQHAHGLQELEFIRGHSDTEAARLCVDQWLKMPGLKPGTINMGRKGVPHRTGQTPINSNPILCPVMHCNRKFDNGHLLLGHLKRFDHSPCDPAITLRGPPTNAVACVVCCKRFVTSQQYSDHLLSKINDDDDGHKRNLPPQLIQCFACPYCFLLFSIRDECLQHMSGKNHFLQVFKLSDETGTPLPLSFPSYAKKLLIALCKEVPFQVKCTSCHQKLRSHMELTAHFRTRCRNAGPVSLSEKSISQVAEIFKARGHCQNCDKLFVNESQINQHSHATQHKVKIITTMEESILMFCHINERNKNPSQLRQIINQSRSSLLKRPLTLSEPVCESESAISKRKKDLEEKNQEAGVSLHQDNTGKIKAWFCECLLKFSTEESVEKHILSANRICHKCAVCGKLAENSSIIRLHMSRFHGGAHLTNFIFWCRACNTDLLREENIMAHVTEFHGGHSYYYEQEAVENEPLASSSDTLCNISIKWKERLPSPVDQSLERSPILGKWQCCICEEMFESEDSVKQHCMSLGSHQFHRYCCGLCKKHFHKVETLYRHCQGQHSQEIQVKYFCGLCGDLFFDVEEEFLIHYKGFHSTDYMFVTEESIKNKDDITLLEKGDFLTCGCREEYMSRINRKEDHRNCQKTLLEKGNLWFRCCFCSATAQNFTDLNDHLSKSHTPRKSHEEMYVVRCGACNKNFHDIVSAHQHYHDKHCFLQKPDITHFGSESESKVFNFTASGACVDKKPDKLKFPANVTKVKKKAESPSLKREEDRRKERSENKACSEEHGEEDSELPDFDYLRTMTHIVLVDLDNWGRFFIHLPANLNQGTFVWGFQGGHSNWKPPEQCKIFNYLNKIGCFFLHPRCGTRREAADFALCMHAGRLDEHLPKQIPFTILSGDKSFLELEDQFKKTQRTAHILNPHDIDGDMMCALLNSISDTTKEEDVELQEAIKRSLEEM
ncbi:E3 SUMO-protein ligase ZNF451 isoform X3 [Terrapene carolina triunguis]|uniref:E3 SUMO-protein ligase ZNF451 isoform X3 n=1 Tax=Terrapene triunguis TaxID=2587831 RepID=UPI000CEF5D82|nr:E3 SUMO-protein ligase ZNF451 isoform X3 [Terrapene carolina triunguis]